MPRYLWGTDRLEILMFLLQKVRCSSVGIGRFPVCGVSFVGGMWMMFVLSVLISMSFLLKKLSAVLRMERIPSLELLIQIVSSTNAR